MNLPHGIVRLTANNKGPFTHEGTNSYLVGRGEFALIDPGPVDEAHAQSIVAAAAGRPVTHILLTHAHRDHVDGLAWLKQLTGATTYGYGRGRCDHARPAASDATASPSGGDYADWSFTPDVHLEPGQTIVVPGATLEAVHTPGHAPDHLCFALVGTPVLFSGDHVMGWSTSVIAPPEGNMADYLAALQAVIAREEVLYLPGHGAPVEDGRRTARAYLIHRQMRETAILDAIRGGAATIPAIAGIVYSGIAPDLVNAARLSVQAHVEHLASKRLLSYQSPLTQERHLGLSS